MFACIARIVEQTTDSAPSAPLTDIDAIASAMGRFAQREEDAPPEAKPEAQATEPVEEQDTAAAEGEEVETPAEDAPAGETDTDDDPLVELSLDDQGNPRTVKLSELRKGYLRQSDYTKKTQELAEGRRVIEQAAQQIALQRQHMATEIGETLTRLQQHLPQDDAAELAELERTDPGEWSRRQFQRMQRQQAIAQAAAYKQQIEQQNQAQRVQQEAAALAEKVPEWKDRDRATRDLQSLERFACEAYGFTPEVLASVVDHRFVLMVRDAKTGREATRSAAKLKPQLKALPKIQRPNAAGAQELSSGDEFRRSISKLQRTGGRNLDDIASAFSALGKKGRR